MSSHSKQPKDGSSAPRSTGKLRRARPLLVASLGAVALFAPGVSCGGVTANLPAIHYDVKNEAKTDAALKGDGAAGKDGSTRPTDAKNAH